MFPVYAWIMALQPVVSKVNILLSKIGYGEIDMFAMLSNRHREFHKLCDIPALIVGSVGIVDRYGDQCFLHVELMLFNIHLIDGAPGAATVNQGLRGQGFLAGDGFDGHRDREVPGCSTDILDRFAEFIESFDCSDSTDPKFFEKLVGEFS